MWTFSFSFILSWPSKAVIAPVQILLLSLNATLGTANFFGWIVKAQGPTKRWNCKPFKEIWGVSQRGVWHTYSYGFIWTFYLQRDVWHTSHTINVTTMVIPHIFAVKIVVMMVDARANVSPKLIGDYTPSFPINVVERYNTTSSDIWSGYFILFDMDSPNFMTSFKMMFKLITLQNPLKSVLF